MSHNINRLNMKFKILKKSIDITKNNLLEESRKRNVYSYVEHLLSILECSIDQTDKLFNLARNEGEVQLMKDIIQNNFGRERLTIQNLAIKIFRVTRSNALEIIFDLWKNTIDEQLKYLQMDYEDIVKNCTSEELLNNPDYNRVVELFSDHQSLQRTHHALFMEAKADNNVDNMYRTIAYDIPLELKAINEIRQIISRL